MDWHEIVDTQYYFYDIKKKDEITKDDIENLKKRSKYLEKFLEIYNDEFAYKENIVRRYKFFDNYKKLIERSNKLDYN